MEQLAAAYPKLAHYVGSIGTSVEGRDIVALRISNFANGSAKKQVIVLAGQHAREWISIAAAQYCAYQLVSTHASDSRVKALMKTVEIIFIPIVNPDGYEYTWTIARFWRKNRGVTIKGVTYGVDLNRNWDDHWGGAGGTAKRTSEIYRGPAAFSEPETEAVSEYLDSLTNTRLFMDLHSYSQLILRPYGWTKAVSPDESTLAIEGDLAVGALKAADNSQYISEAMWQLYFASGNATDWVYGVGTSVGERPPGAFTIELSPAGNLGLSGFAPPADQIVPVGNEVFEALQSLSEYALGHPLKVKK